MFNEIDLRPMTDEEFAKYAAYTCENYAQTSPHYRNVSPDRALADVKAQFHQRLKNGPRTEGYFVMTIWFREDGLEKPIGVIDMGLMKIDPTKAYLWNIELNEDLRGKGFGKRALAAAEEFLRQKGCIRLGLNVHANNRPARALYEQTGFEVTQMNLEKDL